MSLRGGGIGDELPGAFSSETALLHQLVQAAAVLSLERREALRLLGLRLRVLLRCPAGQAAGIRNDRGLGWLAVAPKKLIGPALRAHVLLDEGQHSLAARVGILGEHVVEDRPV